MAAGVVRVLLGSIIVLSACVYVVRSFSKARNIDSRNGLVADSYAFDFGEVDQLSRNVHKFTIKNNSSVELQVVEIKSSCTCTVVADQKAFDSPMVPGESRVLSASLDANGFSNEAKGKIILTYTQSGAATASTTTLGLFSRVRQDYVLPSEIDVGILGSCAKFQSGLDVELQSISQANPITIVAATCSDPSVVISRVTPSKYLLAYTAELTGVARDIRIPVVFETSSRTKPRSVLYLIGNYIPDIELSPEMLVIGSDQSGILERVLQVRTRIPSRISLIGLSDSLIRANYDGKQFGVSHAVNLTIHDIGKKFSIELQLRCESLEGGVVSSQLIVCRFSAD